MTQIRSRRLPTAAATDPMIGVHVLSEFIFCRRSGLLALEKGVDDEGYDPEECPRLNYVPDYFLREIIEQLEAVTARVWRFLTFAAAGTLVLFLVGATVSWWLAGLLLVPIAPFLYLFVLDVRGLLLLHRRRTLAAEASGVAPDPNHQQSQQINWWALREAGFESIRLAGALHDRSARLVGRPWAVLQRGGMRIPVFLHTREDRKIFPQHRARMAAYCHLISTAERAQAPYGIILFAGSYDGITVPMNDANWSTLERGLEAARTVTRNLDQKRILPEQPNRLAICKKCLFGRPERYKPGETEVLVGDAVLTATVTDDVNDNPCVSRCGTRYRWVPPHEKAIALGLTN